MTKKSIEYNQTIWLEAEDKDEALILSRLDIDKAMTLNKHAVGKFMDDGGKFLPHIVEIDIIE